MAKTQAEIYDDFITEVQSQDPTLTDTSDGSILDVLGGVVSVAVSELTEVTTDEFKRTFIDTSDGPEVTEDEDDLERLAVDHFGDDFARPEATFAEGTVAFSRANADAGDCVIPAGTIVKTVVSATGTTIRFETEAEVTLTGLTINASVVAVVAGPTGNVNANKIVVIEDSLSDPTVVVTNAAVCSGGEDAESDAEYRETIRLLVTRIRGGTLASIEAAALAVAGVEQATGVEIEMPVIEYDIATDDIAAGAEFFRIPFATLYIADSNGTASDALVALVQTAIDEVRSSGVYIRVLGATAVAMNWTTALTLDISGPNYATLSSDPSMIMDSMAEYINELAIGADFDVSDADAAMLAIWGPAGTGDLTAFATTVPVGDTATAAAEKLIAGTMAVV